MADGTYYILTGKGCINTSKRVRGRLIAEVLSVEADSGNPGVLYIA